jgi:hypothetical protein
LGFAQADHGMILLGIEANDPRTAFVAAAPTLLGQFDFVNHTYSYGGTSHTAAEITDKTTWIGSVGGNGLVVPASQPAGASLILSPLRTFLAACQWTVVLDVQILAAGVSVTLFTVANATDAIFVEIGYQDQWYIDTSDEFTTQATSDNTSLGTGIHHVAATRTDSNLALSIDHGSLLFVDPTATVILPVGGNPMTHFYLGGWSSYTDHAVNIRSMSVYDAVHNSLLPTL